MARIQRLDHVAIIVRDLDEALASYERLLGLRADRIEDYGPGALRIAFIPVGETQIELIQPLREDHPNSHWLREHGEGIQHLAFRVDDLEEAIAFVRQRGGRLATPEPLPGAGNTRIVFLDPGQLHGTSVELCAAAGDGDGSEGRCSAAEGGDSP
ncbi:MAG TPA: VOC family protein [Thermaerobacter sp.]